MRYISAAAALLLLLFGPCSAFADAAEEVSNQGLIAHYKFDEGKGNTTKDSSPSKFNATVHSAKWVKRDDGFAAEFDGKSAYVDCGPGKRLPIKDRITVAVRVFPKGPPSGEPMLAGEHPKDWGITHYKGHAYFYISGGGNYIRTPVPFHKWSHVAGTYDGKTMRLYVDGVQRKTRELPAGTAISNKRQFYIGGRNTSKSFFCGLIDDVRIYNRTLSKVEIERLGVVRNPDEDKMRLTSDQRNAATSFFKQHRGPVDFKRSGAQLWLANRHLGIELIEGERGIYLSRILGIAAGEEFLHSDSVFSREGLWQLVLRRDKGRNPAEVKVTSLSTAKVRSEAKKTGSAVQLTLKWEGIAVADEPNACDVTVTVSLNEDDPLSRWRIHVANRSKAYGLWEVVFPVWELSPVGDNVKANAFACGRSRGTVTLNPFNTNPNRTFGFGGNSGCYWPGTFDMQFQALYDESRKGLYLATHDGGGFKKRFFFSTFPEKPSMEYRIAHFPANMGYPAEDYGMTYDVVLGPFTGDWYDACQIYRKWAVKQRWCEKGPLAMRKDVPRWFKEAPLHFSTMTKEGEWRVDESRDRMIAMLKFIGTDLPVAWYTWKKHFPDKTHYNREGSPWKVPDARPYPCGNIHDGNYPLMPAMANFGPACKAIREHGGHVKAYVCSRIFDPGLNENSPLCAQAKPHAVRDLNGKVRLAERGIVSWSMCYYSPWWRNRMAETVTELIKREHVGGIYFDTFYGGYVQCFHTAHGHSHGGGDDPYLGSREISHVVRGAMKKADPESVMTGESPAETAIDLLDGFLYRVTVWPDVAPLFATVYGDYICRTGIGLDTDSDGFYIQCATLFTEGCQMGRMRLNTKYDVLKDPRFKEKMQFLRKLCRMWRPEAGARYLAYGQLLRPLRFSKPDPMPAASYQEPRYKYYKDGTITVPALQAGVFQAPDGSIGVFIVNVTEKPLPYRFELTPDRYPVKQKLSFSGEVEGRDVVFLKGGASPK